MLPSFVEAWRNSDPAIKHGHILTYEERVAEDSPSRDCLSERVTQIVGRNLFEHEDTVQQILLALLSGEISWREFLRNRQEVITETRRKLKRDGVIYDGYGQISLQTPVGENGGTIESALQA